MLGKQDMDPDAFISIGAVGKKEIYFMRAGPVRNNAARVQT